MLVQAEDIKFVNRRGLFPSLPKKETLIHSLGDIPQSLLYMILIVFPLKYDLVVALDRITGTVFLSALQL